MFIVFGRKTNQIQEGKNVRCNGNYFKFLVWVFFLLFDFAAVTHRTINIPQIIRIIYYSSALFRLGARARALCPGTKMDVVQTPWCRRSNRVLLRQLSARHFVCCIVGKHEEKMWELTKSCSDQCPRPGTVPRIFARAPTKSSEHSD